MENGKLKEKQIMAGGQAYTVREARVKDILPLLPRFSGDENAAAQLDLVGLTTFKDGEALGDAAGDLGFRTYAEVLDACLDVNGIGDEGKG